MGFVKNVLVRGGNRLAPQAPRTPFGHAIPSRCGSDPWVEHAAAYLRLRARAAEHGLTLTHVDGVPYAVLEGYLAEGGSRKPLRSWRSVVHAMGFRDPAGATADATTLLELLDRLADDVAALAELEPPALRSAELVDEAAHGGRPPPPGVDVVRTLTAAPAAPPLALLHRTLTVAGGAAIAL
jgi:hypothetical protein